MYKVRLRRLLLSLLASTSLCGVSLAQQPSGSVVGTNPTVDARGPGGERILQVEGFVYQGDELVARPAGLAQIRFVDDTRLVVGPNSRLVIDEFVFNPDQTAQQVTIRMAKGAFRFLSGNSPSNAYSIRTPTMTIGMRGTVLDVYAAVNGDESGAVFHDGAGDICDSAGSNCVAAIDDCRLFVVPQDGTPSEATGLEREVRMQVRFPFVNNQGGLDDAFRTDTSSCTSESRARAGTPLDNSNEEREPVIREFEGKDSDDEDVDDGGSGDDLVDF